MALVDGNVTSFLITIVIQWWKKHLSQFTQT